MAEWEEVDLAALGALFDGPHATPERVEEGPYFLNIASLDNGRLDLEQSDHISREEFAQWTRRVTPVADDLLFSYETRLGEAALMPAGVEACLGRRMALLRPDRARVHPRFLLYLYLSPAVKRTIEENTIHGATVNRIALSTMGKWRVKLPPMSEQRAIAEVLGALDDKIAANTRLATAADDLALAVYDSELSGVPLVSMHDVLEPILGGTPARDRNEYWSGDVPWASARDVAGAPMGVILQTLESISSLAASTTRARRLAPGTVVLTARGTVGAVGRLPDGGAVNQSCYAFEPGLIPPGVLYLMLRRVAESLRGLVHGSVFDTINMSTFQHVSVPELEVVRAPSLERRVAPLLGVVESRIRENATLAATRDALLPALMSGALRVRYAERLAETLT